MAGGIDLQLHGDFVACAGTAEDLSRVAQSIRSVSETVVQVYRGVPDVYEGWGSQNLQRQLRRHLDNIEELAGKFAGLAIEFEMLGSIGTRVSSDLLSVRENAVASGLSVVGHVVQPPRAPFGEDEADQERFERQRQIYLQLATEVDLLRVDERRAHADFQSRTAQVTTSIDLTWFARKLGLVPRDGSNPAEYSAWAAGASVGAFGFLVAWLEKVTFGQYKPRWPKGSVDASGKKIGGRYRTWDAASKSMRTMTTGEIVRDHFRFEKGNGRFGLPKHVSSWGSKSGKAVTLAKWGKASKVAGPFGTAISVGTAGWNQWKADSDDPDLSTVEKGARTATKATTTGAGGWAGAWGGAQLGGAIGLAVGGPVGAAAGAIIGGVIGGAAGAEVGSWFGDIINRGVESGKETINSWLN